MSPEVTAVITTNGRPARVQEALASLRAETYPNFEVVLVDDGGEFVPSAEAMPVRIIRGGGLGVARARNLGLSAARGEFVLFLDDDDVALPHRISTLVAVAVRHHASLCFGRTRRRIDHTPQLLPDVPTHAGTAGPVGFCDLLSCAPHVNAVLARTETLRAVGGFDVGADHFDDWSAWLRIADCNPLLWSVAETVAEWRIHDSGLSARVLAAGAMKNRLMALFDRLQPCLCEENARAVEAAQRIVALAPIRDYDDYANAMAEARSSAHEEGKACFAHQTCRRPPLGTIGFA